MAANENPANSMKSFDCGKPIAPQIANFKAQLTDLEAMRNDLATVRKWLG